MMMVAKATPVSRPAERRSVGRVVSYPGKENGGMESGRGGQGRKIQRRTVISLPPLESALADEVVEYEASHEPKRILSSVGGCYMNK